MEPIGEAERRQLTVLFCDMVGSTRIATEVGPELWLEVLRAYQHAVAEVVERFDGSIAQFLGDGVVVYFGHPHAHEDDAERATRAGLAIVESFSSGGIMPKEANGMELAVRVGIHTGPVVVGEVGSGRHLETRAVGATTDIAGRVQGEAEPGQVLVSGATLRLARGIFATDDLGPVELKDIAAPVPLHRVLRPTGAATRLDVEAAEGLTPFVARAQELDLLRDAWSRAREGHGQVALLGGEAGMGKSRLMRVFRSRLADESHRWIECRASKFHTHTAFHPLITPLAETLGVNSEQSQEQQLVQLEQGVASLRLGGADATSLFANLLGISATEGDSPFADAAEARLEQTLEALTRWLLALTGAQPVVFIVEDLHWSDTSTLDFLSRVLDRVASAPLLVVPTYRLNFHPSWTPGSNTRRVTLNPLTRAQAEAMMLGVTGGRALPDSVRSQVVAKTDGVPLYIEEFTQTVLDSGVLTQTEDGYEETGPIPDFSVPATLRDSLMARLDRLGPAKSLAQIAAVLGREFARELLASVATESASLDSDLDSLLSAGIFQRVSSSRRPTYAFKHALIQETAYESLLVSRRRTLHARIVHAVEKSFPAIAFAEPERLAWHCEEGELIHKAVGYCHGAAEQARRRSVTTETVRYLKRGIALLAKLPDDVGRSERELMLQLELGMSLVATEGWGSNEAISAYRRARELCKTIGDLPQVFRVMRGLITFYTARAELGPARELTERLVELAAESGESQLLLLAHQQKGIIHYFEGSPAEALREFEKASGLYEPSEHRHLAELHGEDLGVFARIWMAWPQWLLGFPDQAVETSLGALDLGEEVGHRFSLAYAFVWTAILYVMRREPERAREMAEQAIAISEQQGFGFLLAEGQLVVAWCRLQGQLDERATREAAAEFQDCVTRVGGRGIMANAPMMTGYLSEAYQRAGMTTQAMASVNAGLGLSQATEQLQWDAELQRLKGEYLRQDQGNESEVEALFERGLEIARRQNALSLELRVAMSLARLWEARGEGERARGLIAPIYARFTEGFNCPDLQEARALLDG